MDDLTQTNRALLKNNGDLIELTANENEVVTLGALYRQDLEKASFMTAYPSTFNENTLFLNSKKYIIHDYAIPGDVDAAYFCHRFASVVGSAFPLLVHAELDETLLDHWKIWLPGFPLVKQKHLDEGIRDKDLLISIFPIQDVDKEVHVIDPDLHYTIMLKSRIPRFGAPHPKYFTRDNVSFPCVVKVKVTLN